MKILIIDDEEYRHDFIGPVLHKAWPGADIYHAYHADRALKLFEEIVFDVVFFDHDLGFGKNGSDIARAVVNDPHYKKPQMAIVHSLNYKGATSIQSHFTSANILCALFSVSDIIDDKQSVVDYINSSFVTSE